MSYKKILGQMLKIYKPKGIDWMGISKENLNPYSFHHIYKKMDGGENKKTNGAILTIYAHRLLHDLEIINPDLYENWNKLFLYFNKNKRPLDNKDYFMIYKLKMETDMFMDKLNEQEKSDNNSLILKK